MKLKRLSKKNRRMKILGSNAELDLCWASGPGFRDGPQDYFGINVEADDHNFSLEFDIEEARRIKVQLDKFLLHIDNGSQFWEPGNYFKNLKKNSQSAAKV